MWWRAITAASRATLARMTNGFLEASGSVDMDGAGALQLAHHRASGRGHDRAPALRDERRGKIDRAALDPAGDEARQHLQHARAFPRGSLR